GEEHDSIGCRAHGSASCLRGEGDADVRALMTEIPRLAAVVSLAVFVDVGIVEVDAGLVGDAVDGPREADGLVGGAARPRSTGIMTRGARIAVGAGLAHGSAFPGRIGRTRFVACSSISGARRARGIPLARHSALNGAGGPGRASTVGNARAAGGASVVRSAGSARVRPTAARARASRSEERRVGKECRARWSPYQ